MSGHSKWAQIKRQKGAADIKRGQMFTKIANAITIAVRQGGGITDPTQNFRLRLLIEKARATNMPKENVERAIERGAGRGEKGKGLEEVIYEGFGPGGISLIVEVTTDNKQRTTAEIRNIFEKNDAILATPGSVSYQFESKGLITVNKENKTIDDIFLMAADAGAEDVEEAGDKVLIYTKPLDLTRVKDMLVKNNLSVSDFELTREPITPVKITSSEIAKKILSFIEKIEGLDDVQRVFASFDIPDELNIL